MIRFANVILLAACLAFACGCSTTYGPLGGDGGYYEQKLSPDTYIVGFSGNDVTSYEDVQRYAFVRAIDIGAQLEYKYMEIEGEWDNSGTYQLGLPQNTFTSGTATTYPTGTAYTSSYSGFSTGGPSTVPVRVPGYEMRVKYYKDKPEHPALKLYDIDENVVLIRKWFEDNK
ncbi:MAG: hypothetical protein Q7Q73_03380 [Verrucomicrobiota bacterium JB024]|nr:hypothetical protein [Verrucomicrobiota bacterium JB024]